MFPVLPAVLGLTNKLPEARSITLIWLPIDTKYKITKYIIAYTGTTMWGDHQHHEGTETYQPLEQNNETVTFELKNLRPYTKYQIQVLAANEATNGTSAYLPDFITRSAGGSIIIHKGFNAQLGQSERKYSITSETPTPHNKLKELIVRG